MSVPYADDAALKSFSAIANAFGQLPFVLSFFDQHLVKQRLNIGLILRYPFYGAQAAGRVPSPLRAFLG